MNVLSVSIAELVREIHSRPLQLVIAVTGGGAQAIAELLGVPGGSRTILEALVPYSSQSLTHFLRATPESFCSAQTARAMAMAAFSRVRQLTAGVTTDGTTALSDQPVWMGVGCTASLASDRPKLGPHRVHLAIQTADSTETLSLELSKGARSRSQEESIVARLVLNQIAAASGTLNRVDASLLPDERVDSTCTQARPPWRALLLGEVQAVEANSEEARCVTVSGSPSRAIFSGAFNPLHDGHRQIMQVVEQILQIRPEFEISIENVDKPPLDYTEISLRAAQFRPPERVWLTRAPTFVEKSQIFPNTTFVVGADTIERIAAPRYYGDDATACAAAIQKLKSRGCRFLVCGRAVNGRFVTLEEMALPPELLSICQQVPEAAFRMDISSTEIRQRGS